jgi:predicted nucleic acid-binding protein
MRPVSSTLVVDAAILVPVVLGRMAGAMVSAQRRCALITTDRAIAEAGRRIELGLKRPDMMDVLNEVAGQMTVVPLALLSGDIARAEEVLRDTAPNRSGSTTDAHLLVLGWAADADIWTHDRDFAGAGIATWSTINLMRALARQD